MINGFARRKNGVFILLTPNAYLTPPTIVLSPIQFTPPTRTKQNSVVLFVSAVFYNHVPNHITPGAMLCETLVVPFYSVTLQMVYYVTLISKLLNRKNTDEGALNKLCNFASTKR